MGHTCTLTFSWCRSTDDTHSSSSSTMNFLAELEAAVSSRRGRLFRCGLEYSMTSLSFFSNLSASSCRVSLNIVLKTNQSTDNYPVNWRQQSCMTQKDKKADWLYYQTLHCHNGTTLHYFAWKVYTPTFVRKQPKVSQKPWKQTSSEKNQQYGYSGSKLNCLFGVKELSFPVISHPNLVPMQCSFMLFRIDVDVKKWCSTGC